jgi:hypothetical protein
MQVKNAAADLALGLGPNLGPLVALLNDALAAFPLLRLGFRALSTLELQRRIE